ncbi:MAG TPA: hypothetical protein VMG62_05240 [Solirubrobacteraceae bacterium]|nr:hypothetical protein [Solirubrobacteraceae bacterium]
MEWLAIVIWLLIAALALPLGGGAALGRGSLAVQAIAGVGGFALLAIYVIVGTNPATLAWVACGLGVLGVLAMAVAAAGLTSDHEGGGLVGLEGLEEHVALLAGVQLPLFAVAALFTMLVALEIGT